MIFPHQALIRVCCLLPLWWWGALSWGAETEGDPAGADRLMERGAEQWATGDHEAAVKSFEAAIAIDQQDAARPYHYAERVAMRGHELSGAGDVAGAAAAYAEAERLLVVSIRRGQAELAQGEWVGRGYRLLGEIAASVRQDRAKATEYFAQAERASAGEAIETEPSALFGPVDPVAARRVPRIDLGRPREVPQPAESPGKKVEASPVSIGVANSVQMAGRRLRLAGEGDRETAIVREYVPVGETLENWTTLFAQRQHRQSVAPTAYASSLAELAARNGGKVISATRGPGDSASIAFVVHAPDAELSEVNAWRFTLREGRLISLQYAERVRGADHEARSERLAKERCPGWLRELQVRRPVGLGDATERLAATTDAAGE